MDKKFEYTLSLIGTDYRLLKMATKLVATVGGARLAEMEGAEMRGAEKRAFQSVMDELLNRYDTILLPECRCWPPIVNELKFIELGCWKGAWEVRKSDGMLIRRVCMSEDAEDAERCKHGQLSVDIIMYRYVRAKVDEADDEETFAEMLERLNIGVDDIDSLDVQTLLNIARFMNREIAIKTLKELEIYMFYTMYSISPNQGRKDDRGEPKHRAPLGITCKLRGYSIRRVEYLAKIVKEALEQLCL